MLVFAERSEGVGASEASRLIHRLSTGYPQALRRSIRPRAKRARPLYYSPHEKKEGLKRPLRGSYGYLNAIFCSQTLYKAF